MSNIAVLSTVYLDIPSANGICARNIVSALLDLGHHVDVLCYPSENDRIECYREKIHTIKRKEVGKSFFSKVKNKIDILLGTVRAKLDYSFVESYYNALCDLMNDRQIDTVVAMFFSLESAEAIYRFKLRYPGVKAVIYEIDSIGDGVANSSIQGILNKTYERWLNKVYSVVDTVFVMKSHENYWRETFSNRFGNKLIIADLPILKTRTNPQNIELSNNSRLIYSGIIDHAYRSPTFLLAVLDKLSLYADYDFFFYSKGDSEEEIEEASRKNKRIHSMGFIKPEILEEEIGKSDFLVSIGNSISRSVPSKLIDYISYGKPIIHFSSQKDDICKEYLKFYPLSLVVDQNEAVDEKAKAIYEFMEAARGKYIKMSDVKTWYYMNDPCFSAKRIVDAANTEYT